MSIDAQIAELHDAIERGTPLHLPPDSETAYAVLSLLEAGLARIKEKDGSITSASVLMKKPWTDRISWSSRGGWEFLRDDGTVAFKIQTWLSESRRTEPGGKGSQTMTQIWRQGGRGACPASCESSMRERSIT